MRKLHAHRYARLFEFALWGVPGLLVIVGSILGRRAGVVSDAFAMIFVIVGLCLVGWGLLPPRKAPQKKPPVGRLRAGKSR